MDTKPASTNPELDYSAMPVPETFDTSSNWETPQHKFFGRKDVNGKPEKEPPQVFQPFPTVRYAQPGGKGTRIVTKFINNAEELKKLGPGWESTSAAFGHVGAPSREDYLRMTGSEAIKLTDQQAAADAEAVAKAQAVADAEVARLAKENQDKEDAAMEARIEAIVQRRLAAERDADTKNTTLTLKK